MDTFILPWCEAAYANKNYDAEEILDAIQKEIKRLDVIKLSSRKGNANKTRLPSVASSEVKCAAKGCKYPFFFNFFNFEKFLFFL